MKMKQYVVQCYGREQNNKTKARLFGKRIKATSGKEAILRYRQFLKRASKNGYVEYGSCFEGNFSLGHMVFHNFQARMI